MSLLGECRESIAGYLKALVDEERNERYKVTPYKIAQEMLDNKEMEKAFDILLDLDLVDGEKVFAEILFRTACFHYECELIKGDSRVAKLIDEHARDISTHLKAALTYTPNLFEGQTRHDMERAIAYYRDRHELHYMTGNSPAVRRPGAAPNINTKWMIFEVRSLFIENYGNRRGMNRFIAHMVNAFRGTNYSQKSITEKVAGYRKKDELWEIALL